jgi:hypothetical protein
MREYALGDQYHWRPRKSVQHGGRPENGNLDGEGYTVCPRCQRDFFTKVLIRGDIITEVAPHLEKSGYIQSPGQVTEVGVATQPAPALSAESRESPSVVPHGQITPNAKWQLTERRRAALLRLAELGVDVYSSEGSADYTLMIPHHLPTTSYIDIGYLIAQLGNEEFPEGYEGLADDRPNRVYPGRVRGRPPIEFVDSYPHGLKYRVVPKSE